MDIANTGVAGAGTMGSGIAQVFAQGGLRVVLFDNNEVQLNKALKAITANLSQAVQKGKMTETAKQETLERIICTTAVHDLKGDLILEAIVEQTEAKRELFLQLAAQNPPNTLLVSNTSSIPITRIARSVPNPQRVAGWHFFNPAHLMKLVEIIAGAETAPETVSALQELSVKLGKTPVVCKDSPGFIVNRVARHFYVESLKLAEEGVADIAKIDELLESSGFRMGPFKLMDAIGNDINLAVTTSLFENFHFDPKFRPSRLQQQKVEAGHLGKKTGKGFYNYN